MPFFEDSKIEKKKVEKFLNIISESKNKEKLSKEDFSKKYNEALKNIEKAEINNVVLYPFDINEISLEKFFSQKFDAAFIDAQKSQYWDYLQKIRLHLAPENTLLLDDVIKYQNKLTWLYQFIEKMQINYEIFDTEPGDGVMLIE